MDVMEVWFKQSLIYRFIHTLIEYLNHSCLARFVEYIAKALVNSKVAYWLRFLATRPFRPETSMTYRLMERLNKKSDHLREKAYLYLKESAVYRVLTSSRSFQLISFIFIPMVALYAVIDEIGRDILGDFALFNAWDEAFLLISALYVFIDWFFFKRDKVLTMTPVGAPLVLLISASFFLYLNNSLYPQLGLEGFRVVVQYTLWFFILNSYLTDDSKAYLVTRLLVYVGGAMGLHGIMQYILKVPTPSHWTDVAEGSYGTRAFSIVESPNVLGSIFILIIPICLALVLQNKRKFIDRAIFFILLGAMGISLVLTLSRGAWAGAVVALGVFCLAINPRWLILLALGGSSALLVPSVMNRISYMLSPQYITSSLTGGRLLRYQKGLELFEQNKLMGVGLGHFGGAVALNHKDLIPNAFSMDSYWLKTAVEMGIVGIIAFGILIGVLIFWSVRSIKLSEDYDKRLLVAGGFAGLCGVLFHNITENIFEVPYMVVYFWVVASLVFYFGLRSRKAKLQ